MTNAFSRTQLVLGPRAMQALAGSRVAVFGIGGVGGYVVEALARSGIGALDLVDNDTVSLTNLNRQIIALHSTIGQYKVDVAKARVLDIHPACRVTVSRTFYMPESADQFDFTQYDYVVDCVDTVTAKIHLIMTAKEACVPVISSMGAGNKVDPSAFRVADIYDTQVCPLARVMRHEMRKRHVDHLKVVYSTEPALAPMYTPEDAEETAARRALPGSTAFVPSAAGLLLASEVVKDLTHFDPACRA